MINEICSLDINELDNVVGGHFHHHRHDHPAMPRPRAPQSRRSSTAPTISRSTILGCLTLLASGRKKPAGLSRRAF